MGDEDSAFGGVEPCKSLILDGLGDTGNGVEHLTTGGGDRYEPGAPVVGIGQPLHQRAALEIIDDGDNGAGVEAEQRADLTLWDSPGAGCDRQRRIMPSPHPEGFECRVRAAQRSAGGPGQQDDYIVGSRPCRA